MVINVQFLVHSSGVICISTVLHKYRCSLFRKKKIGRNVAKMLNCVQPSALTDIELLYFTLFGLKIK